MELIYVLHLSCKVYAEQYMVQLDGTGLHMTLRHSNDCGVNQVMNKVLAGLCLDLSFQVFKEGDCTILFSGEIVGAPVRLLACKPSAHTGSPACSRMCAGAEGEFVEGHVDTHSSLIAVIGAGAIAAG